MARLLSASVGLAVLITLTPAAPVPPEAVQPSLYFPTALGTKWIYRGPDTDVEMAVTKVERDGRRKLVTVSVVRADAVEPWEAVRVSEEGLVQVEYGARVIDGAGSIEDAKPKMLPRDPPVRLLKLPAKVGEKWEGVVLNHYRQFYTTGKPERLKVPAGEFETVPVDVVFPLPGGGEDRNRYWYAPGIGPVKWTSGVNSEFVLKSFTPGKG